MEKVKFKHLDEIFEMFLIFGINCVFRVKIRKIESPFKTKNLVDYPFHLSNQTHLKQTPFIFTFGEKTFVRRNFHLFVEFFAKVC